MAAPTSSTEAEGDSSPKKQKEKETSKKSKSPSPTTAKEEAGGFLEKILDSTTYRIVYASLWSIVVLHIFLKIVHEAYDIRLHAIKEYGMIIHEFDPWFNYRATEYLHEHGWHAFKNWFDYKVSTERAKSFLQVSILELAF